MTAQSFTYNRNGKEFVTVNPWVAKRRADGASKNPVLGKMVNGRFIPSNHYGKI